MKHDDIIKAIDEFLFEGKKISKDVENHISSCEDCKRYFENSKKFSRGLNQLKSISKELNDKIDIDISTKVGVDWILAETRRSLIRRIVLSLLGVIIVILSGFMIFYYMNSNYISEELAREFMLMEEHVSYIYSFDEVDSSY